MCRFTSLVYLCGCTYIVNGDDLDRIDALTDPVLHPVGFRRCEKGNRDRFIDVVRLRGPQSDRAEGGVEICKLRIKKVGVGLECWECVVGRRSGEEGEEGGRREMEMDMVREKDIGDVVGLVQRRDSKGVLCDEGVKSNDGDTRQVFTEQTSIGVHMINVSRQKAWTPENGNP